MGILGAMAMMQTIDNSHDDRPHKRGDNPLTPDDLKIEEKKVIPKGCKEYFFSEGGRWEYANFDACVFTCIALSEKKANDKFIKWYNKQLTP